jgi:hypothetical protein
MKSRPEKAGNKLEDKTGTTCCHRSLIGVSQDIGLYIARRERRQVDPEEDSKGRAHMLTEEDAEDLWIFHDSTIV